jgi:hypothetical protein
MVAQEFSTQMAARGVTVDVHHIREARPKELPAADLYLFSSPGRFGKPLRGMRRFLEKVELPAGTRYAILTTEAAAHSDQLEEGWQHKVEAFAASIPIQG